MFCKGNVNLVGGIPTPLKNIRLVSWDHYSQLNGKVKNVPNHQPVTYTGVRTNLVAGMNHQVNK